MKGDEAVRAVRELVDPAGSTGERGEGGAARWRRIWDRLELEPPPPLPPGFATRIVARAAAERRTQLGLPLAPAWARAVAAAALVAGIAAGVGLGRVAGDGAESDTELAWAGSTLAEEYLERAAAEVGAVAASAASAGEVER
jgi:hypothetical protein